MKKIILSVVFGILGIGWIATALDTPEAPQAANIVSTPVVETQVLTEVAPVETETVEPKTETPVYEVEEEVEVEEKTGVQSTSDYDGLSNDNYYTNSAGN